MSDTGQGRSFYRNMGVLMLVLVFAGFGSASYVRGTSPLDSPALFHVHGLIYIAWYLLFIFQAHLIGSNNRALHQKLGYTSPVVIIAMLITGFMMTAGSYERGISPIPDTTVHQFLAFPLMDLVGILIFYSMGIAKRGDALFHKHCMLLTGIAIIDPGVARIAISLGLPPLALLLHIGLVVLVMVHDRRTAGKIHIVTWAGFAYVFLRIAAIFTMGATEGWANLMDSIFG